MDDYEEGPETEARMFTAEFAAFEAIQRRAHQSAAVIVDLQNKGPIYLLAMHLRAQAVGALQSLIDIDPTKTAEIVAAQEQVKSFIEACRWIHEKLVDGRNADEEIQDLRGESHDDGDQQTD